MLSSSFKFFMIIMHLVLVFFMLVYPYHLNFQFKSLSRNNDEVSMHENCLLFLTKQKDTRWSKSCSQQPHRRIGFEVSKKKTLTYGIKDRRESNRSLLCWKLNLKWFSRIDTKILSKSLSIILIAFFGVIFCPSAHFWLIS